MKSLVLREFGPPEVLRIEDVPTPSAGPGEVLIEVHSVSVNRTLDLVVRAGKYPSDVRLPLVLGVDPDGVVTAVGEGVQRALEAAATGKIRAIIDRALPLREAPKGHRLLEEERILGKIILDPQN